MNANLEAPEEQLSPRQAREMFLDARRGQIKESSLRSYKFPTNHLVDFCEEHGVAAVGDIDNYVLESWKKQRRNEDIKIITLHNNTKHVRVFIRWCESAGLVEYGVADRMEVPAVPEEGQVSNATLRVEQAKDVLSYLNIHENGTRQQALVHTLWHTGCRISGARALDFSDFVPDHEDGPILKFRNRKALGTPLKNGNSSERNVNISDELSELLSEYVAGKRQEVAGEYDRKPLFTTPNGRVSRQRAYKNVVGFTRPCLVAGNCPHDREEEHCEAAQRKKKAFGCPSSMSPHPIRRGSITYHIDRGWPKEKLAERVDVSVDVLNKHYDARKKEQSRKGREQYLDLL